MILVHLWPDFAWEGWGWRVGESHSPIPRPAVAGGRNPWVGLRWSGEQWELRGPGQLGEFQKQMSTEYVTRGPDEPCAEVREGFPEEVAIEGHVWRRTVRRDGGSGDECSICEDTGRRD